MPAICKIPAIPLAPLNEKEDAVALISLGKDSENNPANEEKKPHENCVVQSEINRTSLLVSDSCITIREIENMRAYMEKVCFLPRKSEITPNNT